MIIASFIVLFSSFLLQGGPLTEAEALVHEKAAACISESYEGQEIRLNVETRWMPAALRSADPVHIESVTAEQIRVPHSTFRVLYRENGQLREQEVQLKVELQLRVPVPAQRITSGNRITDEDLTLSWVELRHTDDLITDLSEVSGKVVRKTLNAGSPIYRSVLSSELKVLAGESLNLLYSRHGLQITMLCEARQSGAAGEEIPIYCKETRKKYVGRITGPGEALWIQTK